MFTSSIPSLIGPPSFDLSIQAFRVNEIQKNVQLIQIMAQSFETSQSSGYNRLRSKPLWTIYCKDSIPRAAALKNVPHRGVFAAGLKKKLHRTQLYNLAFSHISHTSPTLTMATYVPKSSLLFARQSPA